MVLFSEDYDPMKCTTADCEWHEDSPIPDPTSGIFGTHDIHSMVKAGILTVQVKWSNYPIATIASHANAIFQFVTFQLLHVSAIGSWESPVLLRSVSHWLTSNP